MPGAPPLRTLTAGDSRELIEVLLGNPYRRELLFQRRELGDRDVLPATSAGWQRWWSGLPAYLRDETAGIALCLGLCLGPGLGQGLGQGIGTTGGAGGAGAEARPPAPLRDAAQILRESLPEESVHTCAELAARSLAVTAALDAIVGDSEAMRDVRRQGWAAAFGESLDRVPGLARLLRSTPVLILGETGTGKELVASALCRSMPGRFTQTQGWQSAAAESVHLAALPPTLVQSTLFGYEKGAFTGAARDKEGIFERCHEGVVFLDEVAELPPDTQVALLRTLQEGKVRRLDARDERAAAPRVVSATHRDLEQLVADGGFRLDLYHRLSSVVIRLPPLRERRADIPLLVERELREKVDPALRGELKEKFDRFLAEAADYDWPGNVRELQTVLHTLALGLEPRLAARSGRAGAPGGDGRRGGAGVETEARVPEALVEGRWSLARAQAWYCRHVMARTRTRDEAARTLGIDRGTLRRYLMDLPDEP
ncbi:MAG TPA: sigma 54-interacting transcriptional regulator [Polyangia bacterium]|nr:sigma 54-interacting transcriptional regulator [Polyangia bacterium]